MEFLIGFAVLGVLAVLAMMFGHDSRDGYRTREHDLARFGVRWERTATGDADKAKFLNDGKRTTAIDLAKDLDGMVPVGHDGWPPELASLTGPGSKG